MRIDNKEFRFFLKALGQKVKEKRDFAGFTQEDMDNEPYAIYYTYIQKIEYGEKNITLSTIYKICKKLKIHPKDLFDIDF